MLLLNQTWVFSTNFRKVPNIKFHGNISGGNRDDICARKDKRTKKGRADMTKLIDTISDYANALKGYVSPKFQGRVVVYCRLTTIR